MFDFTHCDLNGVEDLQTNNCCQDLETCRYTNGNDYRQLPKKEERFATTLRQ